MDVCSNVNCYFWIYPGNSVDNKPTVGGRWPQVKTGYSLISDALNYEAGNDGWMKIDNFIFLL